MKEREGVGELVISSYRNRVSKEDGCFSGMIMRNKDTLLKLPGFPIRHNQSCLCPLFLSHSERTAKSAILKKTTVALACTKNKSYTWTDKENTVRSFKTFIQSFIIHLSGTRPSSCLKASQGFNRSMSTQLVLIGRVL